VRVASLWGRLRGGGILGRSSRRLWFFGLWPGIGSRVHVGRDGFLVLTKDSSFKRSFGGAERQEG
jgi:hypothetical protein